MNATNQTAEQPASAKTPDKRMKGESSRTSTGSESDRGPGTGNGRGNGKESADGSLNRSAKKPGLKLPGRIGKPPKGGAETTPGGIYSEVIHTAKPTESGDVVVATPSQLAESATASGSVFDDLRAVSNFKAYSTAEAQGMENPYLPEVFPQRGDDAEFWDTAARWAGKAAGAAVDIVKGASPKVLRTAFVKLGPLATSKLVKFAATGVAGVIGGPPAAAATAAILKAATESAPESADGALTPEEEEQVEVVASAVESIIGSDERYQINTTDGAPWRHICALKIHHPDGSMSRGTGFLISERAIATAGHCVFKADRGGFARSIEVFPGMNGATAPYGSGTGSSFATTTGWKDQGLPEADIGCIFLEGEGFPDAGSFGVVPVDAEDICARPVVIAGYPGDKPWAEMWGMPHLVKQVDPHTLTYLHDTFGGQSGSPVFIDDHEGARLVVGIHNYGNRGAGNSATRVTDDVFLLLKIWAERSAS